MKTLLADHIIRPVADGILHSLTHVEESVRKLMRERLPHEDGAAAWALKQILDNDDYAEQSCSAACQDTGLAVFFVDIGQDLVISGNLTDALNRAVSQAYTEGYFRKSVVGDPLERKNTGDNTPAIIHYSFIPGDQLRVTYLAKGAGSENMGALYMLTPSKGRQGVIDSVVDCVQKAGANPCPPLVIGVGIGGDMELASILAKRALTRETGAPSPTPTLSTLESDILKAVNATGIGVQGFGGETTALSVACETAATHIGMLPVAVNIQCHSVRHFTKTF